MSQLIVYARYIKDDDVKDGFLFSEHLQTTTNTDDELGIFADFYEKHQIKRERIRSVRTDDVPVMIKNKFGFAVLI